ncbi:MAG: fumarate hydratase C-terminal domain-containing protein, partial [Erysipelotrichales bacterium]|nr:fumarate hydratase C-terminal domain-containing protein [Erysipelotrichales bacterium]
YEEGKLEENGLHLEGGLIFHTAVSRAGVGPTSSNKLEIESSIPVLSKAGIRMHLGKGQISAATVKALAEYGSCFAIIAPVTALLESKTLSRRCVYAPELGMEAFYELTVEDYPAVIGGIHGKSIYDK